MHPPPGVANTGAAPILLAPNRNYRMNRNRDTGTPLPPDLNYTLAHFFTEEQSQKIESDAAEMVALSGQLLDSLIKFGKQAEAWLVLISPDPQPRVAGFAPPAAQHGAT